jgi:hypothetical protein
MKEAVKAMADDQMVKENEFLRAAARMFWNEQKRLLKALAKAEGAVQKLARHLGRNVPCSHCPFYVYKGCQRDEPSCINVLTEWLYEEDSGEDKDCECKQS